VSRNSRDIEEKIQAFVILHPNENEKGAQLERRVSRSCNCSLPDECCTQKQDAMDKVNQWRQNAKRKVAQAANCNLTGQTGHQQTLAMTTEHG
jgi:hypothetical protein